MTSARSAARFAVLAACALASLAGCAATPPVGQTGEPEAERARAALATLHVDNRTAYRLEIIYQLASRPSSEIGVGHVEPRSVADLAPVPAAEPIILAARTANGSRLTLPPRTFEIDGEWTWQIPADARFVRGDAHIRRD